MNGDTNEHNCPNGSYKCNDCEFVSDSQGGLGVHRVKKHKVNGCDNIMSRLFVSTPKGNLFIAVFAIILLNLGPTSRDTIRTSTLTFH